MTFTEKIRSDYQNFFGNPMSVFAAGAAIGIINVFLFVYNDPWSTLDGILNWGGWIFGDKGLRLIIDDPLSPLQRSGSVINIGLLIGAFASALLSRQFGIRIGSKWELGKGFIGGLLMGTGAVLARGCNIGGFFSATSSFGLNGPTNAMFKSGLIAFSKPIAQRQPFTSSRR